MNNELLPIIISSGVVSALVSLLIVMLFIGKYREKVDRHDLDCDKLSKQFLAISTQLAKLEGGLERDRVQNPYIQSKSPLALTDRGKALLIDSHGKDYIDLKKTEFLEEIKLETPKTAYDVQELSKRLIEKRTSLDEFNTIKEFAYKKGITLDLILEVLGIYLRDILLIELGFKIEDIKD